MASDILSPQQLWLCATDAVKDRINNRSLWETMEQAVGITLEDDVLIIGLNPRDINHASHLTVAEHRNAIERALSTLAGARLRFRVIEGQTLEDWALVKTRDARVAAHRTQTWDRRDRIEDTVQTWEGLLEEVARLYSSTPLRALPQSKARFLRQTLHVVRQAMERFGFDPADETAQRQLARVIDRIATSAEVPATLVALELDRLSDTHQAP